MFFSKEQFTLDRIVRLVMMAVFFWGLVWLLGYLSDVLIPFAIALLLAYLFNPMVNWFHKKFKKRFPAVLLSLLIVISLLTAAGVILIPLVVGEFSRMGQTLSQLVSSSEIADRATDYIPDEWWQLFLEWARSEDIQTMFKTENFWAAAQSVAQKVLPGAWGLIAGTASFLLSLVGLVVVGLYLVFLMLDFEKFSHSWQLILPISYRESSQELLQEFSNGMHRYFRAQASIASTVGILFAIGFWIIDLPLGILMGLFIGLLNMVPYLQFVGLIPAFLLGALHALTTGVNVWVYLLYMLIIFACVQGLQDSVLVPRIMGRTTGLSPAIILLSLSIWGKLLGLFGMIIAIPITCLLWAYYQRILAGTSGSPDIIGDGEPPPDLIAETKQSVLE